MAYGGFIGHSKRLLTKFTYNLLINPGVKIPVRRFIPGAIKRGCLKQILSSLFCDRRGQVRVISLPGWADLIYYLTVYW